MLGVLALSGFCWRVYLHVHRPAALAAVGVFDSAESRDVLPGAAAYGENSRGAVAVVKSPWTDAR